MRKLVRTLQCAAKSALRPSRLVLPMVAAGLMSINGAQAATATNTFKVNINLTASCNVATMSNITANYTSLQASALTGASVQTTAAITCTNSIPYSVALDTGSGGTPLGPLQTLYSDAAVGITYVLALSGASLSPTATSVGSGIAQNVLVQATFGATQPGSCAGALATATANGCNNSANPARLRTFTVTY
jgi:spore coat protein U-like protein